MNALQVYSNDEFGSVCTLTIGDEPWFVGKDVAKALGYSNPQKAIRDHADDEDKTVNEMFTVNGSKETLINESGLYSLILSSKLPSAKRFKRWVTSEILPAIRRQGSYTPQKAETPPEATPRVVTPDDYLTAARIIAGCRNDRLPYVLPLIKKAGIEVEIVTQQALPQGGGKRKDPQTAKLLTVALARYGVSIRALEKLTGIHTVQIYRMRDGTSWYNAERAASIREAIHTLLPELDIDAVIADAS